MIRRARKSQSRKFIGATVPAVLRGIAVFLLFTHQAWANIVCCGVNDIEPQQACHQIIGDRNYEADITAESGHCNTAVTAENERPGVSQPISRLTDRPGTIPWCCQATPIAEPQPPVSASNEQTLTDAAPAFQVVTAFVASARTGLHPPPPKSRPIFLTISCFLI